MSDISEYVDVNMKDTLARIDRQMAEARKFTAESNKLSAEMNKLTAESLKLAAESNKFTAEAAKFSRERYYMPFLAVAGFAGAIGAWVSAYLAHR